MSEIGAGYYRGQDRDISVGDIVAIVISVTFGLPILVCIIYVLYVWIRACYHREEMRRDGTLGEGCFWCWKSSSQVSLNVDELVAAVPAVLPNGKVVSNGTTWTAPAKTGNRTDRSGSSTPTDTDGGVELTSHHPSMPPLDVQQQQQAETVIEVA